MINLIEIVRNECISERNCMLSLYNQSGDSGFLYFKEAQLIEVNAGKLWGKQALATIVTWELSSYNISELPRGIKRTIWEPLDQIFAEFVDAESAGSIGEAIGRLQMDYLEESAPVPAALLDSLAPVVGRLREIPGIVAIFKESGETIRQVHGDTPSHSLSNDWFVQFKSRAETLGEGLGSGLLKEWFLEVSDCRVWSVPVQETQLLIFSDRECNLEEFEFAMREALL